MEIYLGARGQNKLDVMLLNNDLIFNKPHEIVADGEYALLDELKNFGVVNHFHELVWRYLDFFLEEEQYKEWIEELLIAQPDVVIIGDEIGMGIIPAEQKQRDYREVYGRVMCDLVHRARRVTRIMCGIPQVIKEER